MQILDPFSPLAVGETDFFAFNFTTEVGAASMVSTSWTCSLRPYQTVVDPAPQAHILGAFAQTQIETDGAGPQPPGVLQPSRIVYGQFSVAEIGGFTASQAGAVYSLAATVLTSDGRALSYCADLPISSC